MAVGGKRKGSGRPKGTSRYKEDTKPIRIPLSVFMKLIKQIKFFIFTKF